MEIDFTFDDVVKYVKIKNVDGSNMSELISNSDLVSKVESFRKTDSTFNEIVFRMQECHNNDNKLESFREEFNKHFKSLIKTNEELISKTFGIPLNDIETIYFNDGRKFYKFRDNKNNDHVLGQNDKNVSIEDELTSISKENNLSNGVDASTYQLNHTKNELIFYTKEEILNKPDLLYGLDDNQINGLYKLMSMENVVSINPQTLIGNTYDHKTVYAEFNKDDNCVNIIDNSRTNSDIIDHDEEKIEKKEISFTPIGTVKKLEFNRDLDEEKTDKKEISFTPIGTVKKLEFNREPDESLDDMFEDEDLESDEMMDGYYNQNINEYNKLPKSKQMVYKVKKYDNEGFIAFTFIIGEILVMAFALMFIVIFVR